MELFLTSSVSNVAKNIAKNIDTNGKKLVFIYTAAEVEEGGKDADWCQADRKSLIDIGFEVTDYTITNKTKASLTIDLKDYDAIYVSGGNTFYLLQESRKSGFSELIKDLVNQGKLYIGTSAGSVIAGPDIEATNTLDNSSMAPELKGTTGFNLVNFLVFPHWGSEHFRDRYLNRRLEHAYRQDQVPIVIITDNQYIHIKDGKNQILEVV